VGVRGGQTDHDAGEHQRERPMEPDRHQAERAQTEGDGQRREFDVN
jgi:hypothetical protein